MGFIDYHGTKEDHFTEVLEYARAQQEEDWRRKEEEKIQIWLRDLTGSSIYAKLTAADLLKYVIVEYRSVQKLCEQLTVPGKPDSKISYSQLWKDFSADMAARHLMWFHLSPEIRNRYHDAFQIKVFRVEDQLPAAEHYRKVAESSIYRQYFTECFDPTWKGRHYYKWLRVEAKKRKDGSALVEDFLAADRRMSLLITLYLHEIVLPHDDGWMREAEAERNALSEIQGKIRRGTLFAPDKQYLMNPLRLTIQPGASAEKQSDLFDVRAIEEDNTVRVPVIPDSGLDKNRFNSLIKDGGIPNYVAASELLLRCSLPEEIAQTYRQLVDRMPILQDAVSRYEEIYHADLDQFNEYFAPEALKITAVYLDYQAVRPSEKIIKETRDGVFLATKKLLQVVNEKIDEIYRFVTIDANAEAKALETLMSQDGYVDPQYRIK